MAWDQTSAEAEELASAIGHVVMSHNTMKALLLVLCTKLWTDHSLSAVQRKLGRRSTDEWLTSLAKQLNQASASLEQLDVIDRLLAQCRGLNEQRNHLVHTVTSTDLPALHQGPDHIPYGTPNDTTIAQAWDLLTALDELNTQLRRICGV